MSLTLRDATKFQLYPRNSFSSHFISQIYLSHFGIKSYANQIILILGNYPKTAFLFLLIDFTRNYKGTIGLCTIAPFVPSLVLFILQCQYSVYIFPSPLDPRIFGSIKSQLIPAVNWHSRLTSPRNALWFPQVPILILFSALLKPVTWRMALFHSFLPELLYFRSGRNHAFSGLWQRKQRH